MKTCSHCHALIEDDSKVCSQCGVPVDDMPAALDDQPSEVPPPASPKKKKKRKPINRKVWTRRVIRGLLLIILLGGCYAMAKIMIDNARTEGKELKDAQNKMPEVIKSLEDSLWQTRQIEMQLAAEKAAEDSLKTATGKKEADHVIAKKADLVKRIYRAVTNQRTDNGKYAVFHRNATKRFQQYLESHRESLPTSIYPPDNSFESIKVWNYEDDWYAVTFSNGSGLAFRVVPGGNFYQIDDVTFSVSSASANNADDDGDASSYEN